MTTQTDTAMTVTGPPRWPSEADPEIDPGPEAILIAISRDGGVKAYTGKVDYGQGIRSGFAHAIAEELGVYPSRVDVVMGDTAQVPYDRATVGSASTRTVGLQLRRAAASAGQTLREKAAQKWRVRTEKVVIRGGIAFTPDRPDRSASISQLLGDEKLDIQVRDDVKLKDTDDFRIIGQPLTRTDAVARVTGAAKYTRDISLPGMLHGKMLRPPSYGAKLLQLDASRAERTPGFVSLVQDGDFVGVVAESEEAAEYALQAIRSRWEEDRGTASDWNLPALLKETAGERVTLREEGSLDDGFRRADHILEGTYFVPYVANAQMEPSAAVASWDGDYLTVWAANRAPFQERQNLAEWLGIGEYRVRVITPEIGGSFGTKTSTAGYEAARLSQAVGRPVRLTYSREEEFSWSTVRPAALMEVRSGVTEDGEIVAWDYIAYHAGENAFRGRRGADTPYDTGNVRIAVANTESPLRSGSYRSLGGAVNHFARECHMDEIAARLGLDPLELRLRNLSHPRMRRALTTAADKFGWAERAGGPGSGFGVAVGYDAGSYAAECVELSVGPRDVRVQRVQAGFDCGLALNPEGVRNQVEGSIMMGLGTALWEAVEFDGGRVLNTGFAHYRVPRIADAPEIDVALTGDAFEPSTGAGEPAIVPIAAAIANAVRDATGARMERLPIVPHLP